MFETNVKERILTGSSFFKLGFLKSVKPAWAYLWSQFWITDIFFGADSFLQKEPPKITEGSPLGPLWLVSKINPQLEKQNHIYFMAHMPLIGIPILAVCRMFVP